MGAERWLQPSAGETEKIKKFLAPLDGEMGVDGRWGCWFEWKDDEMGHRLEIGYSFGGGEDSLAVLTQRELIRRFSFEKIGADSVGWYTDSDFKNKKTQERYSLENGSPGNWSSWVEWASNYRIEWSFTYRFYQKCLERDPQWADEDEIQALRDMEAWVVERFQELDKEIR